MAKKNILVGQSGGPTSVINASLAGVITAGIECPEKVDKVIGMVHGIEGFRAGTTCVLSDLSKEEIDGCFDYNYFLRHVDTIFERFGL